MPHAKRNEETIMVETIGCIVLILVCLGCTLFAHKVIYWGIRPGQFGAWYVKEFPQWMFPFMIWLLRIAGILGVMLGVWLLIDRR
jgi:hypothetical protein